MNEEKEIFVPIPIDGIGRNYSVSKLGGVWSQRRRCLVKKIVVSKCYKVELFNYDEKKVQRFRIAHLVALTFVKKQNTSDDVVEHMDGNTFDDTFENLRWTSFLKVVSTKYSDEGWKQVHHQKVKTGPFFVSNQGRVWSSASGIIISQRVISGYQSVKLHNTFCHVHRLVASAWCEGKSVEKRCVNHIDCDKMNNYSSNLEWVTHQENNIHARENGLINSTGCYIRRKDERPDEYMTLIDLPNYLICGNGKVYSDKTKRYLTNHINNNGYMRVSLSAVRGNTRPYVHTLVAKAFLAPPKSGQTQVHHKNSVRTDNRVENLEWISQSENMKHTLKTRNTSNMTPKKKVIQIDKDTDEIIKRFESIKLASRETGIRHGGISGVCNEHRKTSGGFKWKFDQNEAATTKP